MVAANGRNLFLWIEPGEISNKEQGISNEEVKYSVFIRKQKSYSPISPFSHYQITKLTNYQIISHPLNIEQGTRNIE